MAIIITFSFPEDKGYLADLTVRVYNENLTLGGVITANVLNKIRSSRYVARTYSVHIDRLVLSVAYHDDPGRARAVGHEIKIRDFVSEYYWGVDSSASEAKIDKDAEEDKAAALLQSSAEEPTRDSKASSSGGTEVVEPAAKNDAVLRARSAINMVVEVKFDNSCRLIKVEHEYLEYILKCVPEDGCTEVPCNINPRVIFKRNIFNGLVLNVNAMVNTENSSVLQSYGDMENLLGNKYVALRRGFIKWMDGLDVESKIILVEVDSFDTEYLVRRYHWDKVNGGYYLGDKHSWQRYTSKPPIECKYIIEKVVVLEGEDRERIRAEEAEELESIGDEANKEEAGGGGSTDTDGGTFKQFGEDPADFLSSVTLVPFSYLLPNTYYGVLLLNGTPIVPSDPGRASIKSYSEPAFICEDRMFVFKTQPKESEY